MTADTDTYTSTFRKCPNPDTMRQRYEEFVCGNVATHEEADSQEWQDELKECHWGNECKVELVPVGKSIPWPKNLDDIPILRFFPADYPYKERPTAVITTAQ